MSKVNETRDGQSMVFGFCRNVASAFMTGESKGCTISGLVVSGVSTLNHAAHDAEGMTIFVSTNATFGTPSTTLAGTVVSHTTGTSAAFTVDAWYDLTGAKQSNTAANAGVFFVLAPTAGMPYWWIALTDSVSAVAGTETGAALGGSELTSNGLARAQVTTLTRTTGSTTATAAKTFTYTGSTAQNIGRCALVNSVVGSAGYAYFVDQINSGTPATVSANGDTLTATYSITVG